MPATTRAAKPAGGRGKGGAKVSKKPGNKTATPKKAQAVPKPRAAKRKRVTLDIGEIPDVDTPPSPPQGEHPKLIIVASPTRDPVLDQLLLEEQEVLKLVKQQEARERIQSLRAQLGGGETLLRALVQPLAPQHNPLRRQPPSRAFPYRTTLRSCRI